MNQDPPDDQQEVTEAELDAFAAKLNAFAGSLDPRERAMLDQLLAPQGADADEDDVAGFAFHEGLTLGLDFLRGGKISGVEGATAYNRWNRTTNPDPPPWRRWNRTG